MKRILLIIVLTFGLVAAAIDIDTSIHPGSAATSASNLSPSRQIAPGHHPGFAGTARLLSHTIR